jgi:hypothetical protein
MSLSGDPQGHVLQERSLNSGAGFPTDCPPPTKDLVRATGEDDDVRLPILANSLESVPDSILRGSRRTIALVERHADDDRILDELLCGHCPLRR